MMLRNRKIQSILLVVFLGLAFLIWSNVSAAIGINAKTQVPIDPDADMLHLLQTEMANPSISTDVKNADRPRLEEILRPSGMPPYKPVQWFSSLTTSAAWFNPYFIR